MSTATIFATMSLTGLGLAAVAARAHYVTRNSSRREVYWFVLALGVTCAVVPAIISAFNWNGALQFIMHTTLVLAAVFAVCVHRRHGRAAMRGAGRSVAYEQEWSAIAAALLMGAFVTVMGYIVVYPLY